MFSCFFFYLFRISIMMHQAYFSPSSTLFLSVSNSSLSPLHLFSTGECDQGGPAQRGACLPAQPGEGRLVWRESPAGVRLKPQHTHSYTPPPAICLPLSLSYLSFSLCLSLPCHSISPSLSLYQRPCSDPALTCVLGEPITSHHHRTNPLPGMPLTGT